ncbi:protein kinase [Novymonas esmeraldas]|uniref:Protein kinase n=1 Tax=Novymonas esmeraldas TaxID=1808958 RepID=A0AAW0F5U0_9TRYP
MSAPHSSSLSPSSVAKKRVVSSPRTAHDLTMRLGSDALHTSRSSMISPLTDILAKSPSQLQPLSVDLGLSPSAWAGRGSGRTAPLLQPGRERGGHGGAPDAALSGAARHLRQGSCGLGRSSLPEMPLLRDGAPLMLSELGGGRHSLAPSFSEHNASTTVPYYGSSGGRSGTSAPRTSPPLFPASATTNNNNNTGVAPVSLPPRRTSVPASHFSSSAGQRVSTASFAASADAELPMEPGSAGSGRTQREGRRGVTGGGSGSGSGSGSGDAVSGAVDMYGLPNALFFGGESSSSATTPRSPSTTVASPPGRSALAESTLTTCSQWTVGQHRNASAGGSVAGHSATLNGICAFSPSQKSPDVGGRQSRAPRLASHLFLEAAPAPENLLPSASPQSPAVREGKRRNGRAVGGGSSQLSVAALDESRTPHCSVDGRTSLSEDSNALTAVSTSADFSRPTAATFVKGELIGKGSYGVVYRGMQRSNNRIIAMKEIRVPAVVELQLRYSESATSPAGPSSSSPPAAETTPSQAKGAVALVKEVEAIKRELTLLRQLNHPNIVRYLNDEIVDGTLRIYMEYVSGGSVTAALRSYGSFEEPQAAALCIQLLQGLSYMHGLGIVHRDLKGDNLLLETSSQLKIADLGTAKSIIASATMTAKIVGTAYFMAPEVLQPSGAVVGTAADIWSVACCVIEMLTGKPPLSDLPNQFSVMMAIGGSSKAPLNKYIPDGNTWSSEVLDFISQCLRANPSDRPTAADLMQHSWFAKMLSGAAAAMPPPPPPAHGLSIASTSVTLTSFLTPTAPAVGRPADAAPPRHMVSPTSSPDLRPAASPGHAVPALGTGRAESHTSSHTSRERKSRKDKRSSSRRHTRDSTSGGTSAASRPSQESSRMSTPQNSTSRRRRDGSEPSGSTSRVYSPPPRKRGSNTRRKSHVPSLGQGLVSDDSRHNSSSEYPVHQRANTSSSGVSSGVSGSANASGAGMVGSGVGGGSGFGDSTSDVKLRGSFLPAIAITGSTAPSPCGFSLDALRGSRSLKTSGSGREPTKAYLYPPDMESASRDSMHLGPYTGDSQHSPPRDSLLDFSVPYNSLVKSSVEGGLSARGAGGYTLVGDLEGTGRYTAPPNTAARRSTPRKNHRSNGTG